MNILFALLPLVMLLVIFSLSAKLATFLTRRLKLTWGMAFLYGLMVVLLSIMIRSGLAVLGIPLSGLVTTLFGLAAQVGFGTWFFATRADTESGQASGWRNGLLLTVATLAIVIAITLLLMLLSGFLRARLMH